MIAGINESKTLTKYIHASANIIWVKCETTMSVGVSVKNTVCAKIAICDVIRFSSNMR